MRLRAPGSRFLLVLCVALAVRVGPAIFEIPLGRDLSEYRDVAEHLLAGEGLRTEIRSFHVVPGGWSDPEGARGFGDSESPRADYAGWTRPPLLPVVLAATAAGGGLDVATRALGPLLFVALVAALWCALRPRAGESETTLACMLVALHPALFELSLTPLTENLALLLLVLAVAATTRLRSPAAAGLLCAAAFLARPNTALATAALAVGWAVWPGGRGAKRASADASTDGARGAGGRSRLRAVLPFLACAAVGPVSLAAIDLAHGVPPGTTPQSFLFRAIDYGDTTHWLHRGGLAASPGELLATRAPEIVRRAAKNAFHYGRAIASVEGSGWMLALAPLGALGAFAAFVRVRREGSRGLARRAPGRFPGAVPLLAAMGLVDLAFFCGAWFTFDSLRFLAMPHLALSVVVATGLARGLRTLGPGGRRSAIRASWLLLGSVAALWGGRHAYRSYVAAREFQLGRPYSNALESTWSFEGLDAARRELAILALSGDAGPGRPVISNEPWLVRALIGAPTILLPYDATPEDFDGAIGGFGARVVAIHSDDWPESARESLRALELHLRDTGWELRCEAGPVRIYRRTELLRAVARAPEGESPVNAGEGRPPTPRRAAT